MFPRFHATARYELIEVQVPANLTQTRFNVPDQPQLRTDQDADIIIQAIETFDVLAVSLSPNNVAVIPVAFMLQTFLILYVMGEESTYRVPLNQLIRIAGRGGTGVPAPFNYELQKLKNLQVDWTKSYFMTATPFAGGTFPTFSFLLGVHYDKLPPGTMAGIRQAEYNNYCNVANAAK
jgi:hypothetical protein